MIQCRIKLVILQWNAKSAPRKTGRTS